MDTARMDLISIFRATIRDLKHDVMEFETFPKNSLIDTYGLTLYVHKGTRPFRPTKIVELLRRSNPRLAGEIEVIDCKEYPMTHAVEKKRYMSIPRIINRGLNFEKPLHQRGV